MAVPNKPEKGDFDWDVTLNAALDWLDERIDGVPAGDSAYEVALENGFEGTEQEWLDSLVGEGGDLVVPTAIKDSEGEDLITFTRTSTGTARIGTPQDDLSLRSARDITLIAGDEGPGNVYIGWGDATIAPDASNRVATIGDIQSATTGDITFDGVSIIGAGTASGDGYGNGTIELVPDAELITNEYQEDQYLIIDPTAPNHIHIRAGGAQDSSSADLFLGAERTHVRVSDSGRTVEVQAKKDETSWTYPNIDPAGGVVYVVDSDAAEPDYNDFMIVDDTKYVITSVTRDLGNTYYETTPSFTFAYNESYTFTRDNGSHAWKFGDYGVATLTLPSENPTIINNAVPGDITLSAYNGVYLSFADTEGAGLKFPDDSLQTTAYIPGVDTEFTVVGGALGDAPAFTGAPLFTGSYVKTGPMVHFRIDVDMDNITSFGTGQYYVDLPFPAKYNYLFRNACLHDVSMPRQYGLSGHVEAGQSRVTLFYTDTSGQDVAFDYNSPALLTTSDNFHIAGEYIIGEAP